MGTASPIELLDEAGTALFKYGFMCWIVVDGHGVNDIKLIH